MQAAVATVIENIYTEKCKIYKQQEFWREHYCKGLSNWRIGGEKSNPLQPTDIQTVTHFINIHQYGLGDKPSEKPTYFLFTIFYYIYI